MSKPSRFQLRLATLVVVSLCLGICIPLILFMLTQVDPNQKNSGLALTSAFFASAVLTLFAGLLTEAVCESRDGKR